MQATNSTAFAASTASASPTCSATPTAKRPSTATTSCCCSSAQCAVPGAPWSSRFPGGKRTTGTSTAHTFIRARKQPQGSGERNPRLTPLPRVRHSSPVLRLIEPVATTAARLVLGRLFLPAPLKYELPYPLHEFLRYLALRGDVLFRGMPGPPLAVLEPTVTTAAHQRAVRAVCASGDPLWALFFGTLRQRDAGVPISIRNAAIAVGRGPNPRRYYYFSLNREYAALD